ncbi:hypothetical protein NKI86_19910 [Mesorhizobium sp. M0320]|uniref:hypothetical protein n=1 Tax=Mesorhizobium sp. M0320 TaxID=2956936 RepID=UPI003336AD20
MINIEGFELHCDAPRVLAEEREVDRWKFEIGSAVDHRDQPMLSEVMSRERTSKGREIYGVRAFDAKDPNPDRLMLAEVLVAA